VSRFADIAAPIAEDLPCGPDPDGNPEIETFVAAAESDLPVSFFKFDRSKLDAPAQLDRIAVLLQQSRDLRLVVLAAKLSILSGNIAEFSDAASAIARLLMERWDDVHPRGTDGDYSLRSAYVSALDDLPTVILPLQAAPLVNDRRIGAVTYRAQLVASGAVPRREKEEVPDRTALHEALVRAGLDGLKAILEPVSRIGVALEEIRKAFAEHAGFEQVPDFPNLSPLVADIEVFLKGILSDVDPSFALSQAAAGSESGPETALEKPQPSGFPPLLGTADAGEALKAIERYYTHNEPSSPAVLLIRQAQQLIGKSFVEALQSLAPALMEKAAIRIGADAPFALTMAQLKTLAGQSPAAPGANGEAPPQSYAVSTRGDAAMLMDAIEKFYRRQEPSSPIPLLLERARLFVDRDFSTLLKDVMSKPPAG
jgi:type VI secretion system protein ImpA